MVELFLGDEGQISPFRKVLGQQPVRVLVRSSLSGRPRVTEVHLDTRVDRALGVLSHLLAGIPCQGLPEVFGELLDGVGQRDSDVLGSVAFWDPEQHHISGVSLHQGSYCRVALPDDEVAFPMAGNGTVLDLGWTFRDHDHVTNLALLRLGPALRPTDSSPCAQSPPQFLT